MSSQDEGSTTTSQTLSVTNCTGFQSLKEYKYKLCSLVYKCLHQLAPQYRVEMCKVVSVHPGRRTENENIDILAAQFCSVQPENLE